MSCGSGNHKAVAGTRSVNSKILVKIEYLEKFSTTICVDRDAIVEDVISTVCTKKNQDASILSLVVKTESGRDQELSPSSRILPFHQCNLALVPTSEINS